MAPDADPYRTLGLARGAPLAEVRKAYRRLAKEHHPDAAGEASLPRFLAIQAAYDAIAGPGAAAATARPGRRPAAPRRPWEADPERADATHRAYGGRSRRPKPGAPGQGAGGATGRSGRGRTEAPPPSDGPARPPNKATLGSTSYDGADAEPFEPDWGGASWYGTTSGTYWTLNPKEYADPRKHGPEYQARARRAAAARGTDSLAEPEREREPRPAPAPTDDLTEPPTGAGAGAPGDAGARSPTHTTVSWWDATSGTPGRPMPGRPMPGVAAEDPPAGHDAPPDASPTGSGATIPVAAAASAMGWAWLDGDRPGPLVRIGRALLGWVPIALGLGWVAGPGPIWLVQLGVLAILLLVPRVAAVAAVAALAALAVAVPAAVLISAAGGAGGEGGGEPPGAALLRGIVGVAWAIGLIVGVARVSRRGAGPLS